MKDYICLLIKRMYKVNDYDMRHFGKHKRSASRVRYEALDNGALKVSLKEGTYQPSDLAQLIYQNFGEGWYAVHVNRKSFKVKNSNGRKRYIWMLVEEWDITTFQKGGMTYVRATWKPNPYRKDKRKARRCHSLSRYRHGSTFQWFVKGKELEKQNGNDWVYTTRPLHNGDWVGQWVLK